MKIGFNKVGSTAIPFEVSKENLRFTGILEKFSRSLIELEAKITGEVSIPCDLCAEEIIKSLNESVKFRLSDGIYKDDDHEYEIVEIENSMIDLDEILNSEIEMFKSNYFCCENCQN
jgi:uncharacterized metal-binding protein YceD (DUF177 family)